MPRTAVHWTHQPRILSEHLAPLPEPLACLLTPTAIEETSPAAVAALGARALLDWPPQPAASRPTWPRWLAPHQVPAAERLAGILTRYNGALLADAVGLGKSYVALAVALAFGEPFALVVPAVLVHQWRALLTQHGVSAPIITHESLSPAPCRPLPPAAALCRLVVVDEAHRFRNPDTNRYRAIAKLVVGRRVLLVTATPVHNRMADLFHLFRLFLRDHDLTALGVPSLWRAAGAGADADGNAVIAAAARLCVARSRERVRTGYPAVPAMGAFPKRMAGEVLRVGTAPAARLCELVSAIGRLDAGGEAAGLFRLLLLSQLASSLPAFRASLGRYEAFLDLSTAAATEGRSLQRKDFRRLFPAGSDDLQLAFFPLVLPTGPGAVAARDRELVRRLCALAASPLDPKADVLVGLLARRTGKTIVFAQPRATVRHLVGRLHGLRVVAITGERGWFGTTPAGRDEVLRAFAPRAQGASLPAPALQADILVTTDLLSEGLNLQDAVRVIHYDLPWSPARLAQRVGRIDRAGSPHSHIETVTFLPPGPLADALALERRLIAKRRLQTRAGAGPGGFDWCDRLYHLAAEGAPPAAVGTCAAVATGSEAAVVLIVRIGERVESVVVTETGVHADPARATGLLERAGHATPVPCDRATLDQAIRRAAPLLRSRLASLEECRWRGGHRDRLSRRLIPWVLVAARRAARQRRHVELDRLDALVSRLALGMTAGEELELEELVTRAAPLAVREVLAWHERLPPLAPDSAAPHLELVAALIVETA